MDFTTINNFISEMALKSAIVMGAFVVVGGFLFFYNKIKQVIYRSVK